MSAPVGVERVLRNARDYIRRNGFGHDAGERVDEIDAALAQQPGALDGVMHKVAAIAHSGGLIGMDPHEALTAIRRLSLPYWRKEEKPEQVDAALAAQPGGTHG